MIMYRTIEQIDAMDSLGIVSDMNYDIGEVRFAMKDTPVGGPTWPVSKDEWESNPTYCIATAAKILALAENNENLCVMSKTLPDPPAVDPLVDKPFGWVTVRGPDLSAVELPVIETPAVKPPVVELPVKGEVHTEPNQQPDGTIGDTGRFL